MSEKKTKKPVAKVIGKDSNVFVTLGICSAALIAEGMQTEEEEMTSRVFKAKNYPEAIQIMREYCDFK